MTKEESAKLKRLFEIYEQPMYRIAYAVLKDSAAAEDAVSDAFMRIIPKIGKIGEPDSPKTKSYVIKTLKNTAIDIYRRKMRFNNYFTESEEEFEKIPDTSENYNDIIFSDKTERMLDSLGETDRQIILLRCSEEMTWREVAKSLNMTESNVRKRYERARKKLLIKEEFFHENKKLSE